MSFNDGAIKVFNVSNGVYIKDVNEDDDDEDGDDDGGESKGSPRSDDGEEEEKRSTLEEVLTNNMIFTEFDEYLMVIVTQTDGTLIIYDEEDPDESEQLRFTTGGH